MSDWFDEPASLALTDAGHYLAEEQPDTTITELL